MSPVTARPSRSIAAIASFACALALLVAMPSEGAAEPTAQPQPPAPPAPAVGVPQGVPMTVEVAAFRVDFDEGHRYGSELGTERLKLSYSRGSARGLARMLEDEGQVTLLHRSEAKLIVGDTKESATRTRIFVGDEKPYLTSYDSTGKDGSIRKSVTQSMVTSGMTVQLQVVDQPDGRLLLDYDLDFDSAFPETIDGQRLIGRARISSKSATTLGRDDMLVERFTRDTSKGPSEFVFVFRPSEGGE